MLTTTTRFQKPIAWFFATIFYFELMVTPVLAQAFVLDMSPH